MAEEDNKKNNKDLLKDIKSKYIIEIIFDNLQIINYLNVIRYNKYFQNLLNKTIANYKYNSKIEIDIIPEENKCGKFINFEEEDEPFFHIYFNNIQNETKRKIFYSSDKIEKIKVIIDYEVTSLAGLFSQCECIKKIDFKKFYRINIVDMKEMFFGCYYLKELIISKLKTNYVENMRSMFCNCPYLELINVSNFNTNNVEDMSNMFCDCKSLKEINLDNFNTNNVTDMSLMFKDCKSLTKLNLSSFNTNNVINMYSMFFGCSKLEELNLSNFNTSNTVNLGKMFDSCESLKKLEISSFDISKVKDMSSMFNECSSLKEISLSNFKNRNILMGNIFDKCDALIKINCSEELEEIIREKFKNIII